MHEHGKGERKKADLYEKFSRKKEAIEGSLM